MWKGGAAAGGLVNRSLDRGGRLAPAETREPGFRQKKGPGALERRRTAAVYLRPSNGCGFNTFQRPQDPGEGHQVLGALGPIDDASRSPARRLILPESWRINGGITAWDSPRDRCADASFPAPRRVAGGPRREVLVITGLSLRLFKVLVFGSAPVRRKGSCGVLCRLR